MRERFFFARNFSDAVIEKFVRRVQNIPQRNFPKTVSNFFVERAPNASRNAVPGAFASRRASHAVHDGECALHRLDNFQQGNFLGSACHFVAAFCAAHGENHSGFAQANDEASHVFLRKPLRFANFGNHSRALRRVLRQIQKNPKPVSALCRNFHMPFPLFEFGKNKIVKWRRERDSNPRNLSAQRFSRPPRSTAPPSLRA